MLTRIHVIGFKSINDAEVRFGPFTCIAGANGAGKSNLFDAILFLHDLANHSIVEAAHRVRDRASGKNGDLRSLFTRTLDGTISDIQISADFIVPSEVTDDFGRRAKPSTTYLTYKLRLKYVATDNHTETIELVSEELTYLPKSDARKRIGFKFSKEFINTALLGVHRAPYIATDVIDGISVIKVSQDGNSGRPSQFPAQKSPRTVLGSANTDERPTILAARREMQSWKLLQLEPTKLRAPDEFSDDAHITFDGAHIPATLERIRQYEEISSRVAELLPEVSSISVDIDNTRRLKTLVLTQRNGLTHKARSLSDGTLRFVALATMAFDPDAKGLICFEEPENGIHPSRITAILTLLRDMAVNTGQSIGETNPLRQVIINTHSPIVVRNLVPDEILVAVPIRTGRTIATAYATIPNSWRSESPWPAGLSPELATFSELLDYLHNMDESTRQDVEGGTLWQLAWQQGTFDFDGRAKD